LASMLPGVIFDSRCFQLHCSRSRIFLQSWDRVRIPALSEQSGPKGLCSVLATGWLRDQNGLHPRGEAII